jgi:AcrR family transcriptional regulator
MATSSPSRPSELASAPESGVERPRLGRPRDPKVDEAILRAVLDLAAEHGLAEVTVDAVAQRAGVGKATIYRRWMGKEAMVLDAWRELVTPLELPDTGNLRADLRAALDRLALRRDDRLARLLPQLVAAARVNAGLGETLAALLDERRRPLQTLLRRAVDRGELRDDVDLQLIHDMIVGPLVYRVLLYGTAPGERRLDELVELVLRAAGSGGSAVSAGATAGPVTLS